MLLQQVIVHDLQLEIFFLGWFVFAVGNCFGIRVVLIHLESLLTLFCLNFVPIIVSLGGRRYMCSIPGVKNVWRYHDQRIARIYMRVEGLYLVGRLTLVHARVQLTEIGWHHRLIFLVATQEIVLKNLAYFTSLKSLYILVIRGWHVVPTHVALHAMVLSLRLLRQQIYICVVRGTLLPDETWFCLLMFYRDVCFFHRVCTRDYLRLFWQQLVPTARHFKRAGRDLFRL